jgi:hypothetical protein
MKKSEMVKAFIAKIQKIDGVEVNCRQFSYWQNQPVCEVDGQKIAWFVEEYSVGNSLGVCCVSDSLSTKELKDFFCETLEKIQDALKEQEKYSLEIEKMLNS